MRRLSQRLLAQPLPPGVDIMKIDVPRTATQNTLWRMTRVSRQQYFYSAVDTDASGERSLKATSSALIGTLWSQTQTSMLLPWTEL